VNTGTGYGVTGQGDYLDIHDTDFFGGALGFVNGIHLTAGTGGVFHDLFIGSTRQEAIYLGTSVFGYRVDNVRIQGVLGTTAITAGTSCYVNEVMGLGSNNDTRFDHRKELFQWFSWAPGTVPAGYGYYDDFSFPGAAFGDQAEIGYPISVPQGLLAEALVPSANMVRLMVLNLGSTAAVLTSANWPVRIFN
jgi:hypothetical protein